MAAHGPEDRTRQAIAAAREVVAGRGRVVVYPAVRAAGDLTGITDVEVVDGIARYGLLQALAPADEDAVIHVHDDARLEGDVADILVEECLSSGRIAVPWSNDRGTDHFAGALPPVGSAAEAIRERRRRTGPTKPVHHVRPCCVAGTPAQLRGLVPLHLAYPGTTINAVRGDMVVVQHALVAHDGVCTERLEEPDGPGDRPLLVAAMIVRDEEGMLPGCLDTLRGVVDRIEVCDTGSSDATVEIAERYDASVSHREWRDDFAWARNQVLERCKDAWWVLSIDADERLMVDDPERLRRFLATAVDEFDIVSIPVEDAPDLESPMGAWWHSPRILSPTAARWQGALHERVVPRERPLSQIPIDDVRIRHIGYSQELIAARDKVSRNLEIARRAYEQEPNGDNALHFARSLDLAGHPASERIEPLEIADERSRDADAASRAFVKSHLAQAYLESGEPDRALVIAKEALDLVPAEDNAAIILCRAALELERYEEILEMNEQRRSSPSLSPTMTLTNRQAVVESTDVKALAALGRTEDAWEAADQILDRHPTGFGAWETLVDLARESDDPVQALTRLVGLALKAQDSAAFRTLSRTVKPDLVARLSLHYFKHGGRHPEVLQIGIMAAALKDEWEVFQSLSRYAELLDPQARHALSIRLRELGYEDQAASVEQAAPPTRPFRI